MIIINRQNIYNHYISRGIKWLESTPSMAKNPLKSSNEIENPYPFPHQPLATEHYH